MKINIDWILRSVLMALTMSMLLLLIVYNLFWSFRPNGLLDFGSFYASGRAVLQGENPYDASLPLVFRSNLTSFTLIGGIPIKQNNIVESVNLNPPILLPFASLAVYFKPQTAMNIWRAISILLFCTSIVLLSYNFHAKRNILWMFITLSFAGIWHTIELGQVYAILLIIIVCAYISYRFNKLIISGVLIGFVIAIKPNFVVWLLFLFVSRLYIMAISSLCTTIFLSAMPAVVYGPEIYVQWINVSANYNGMAFPANNSFLGLFTRFGVPWLGIIFGLLLILFVMLIIKIKKPSGYTIHFLGILVSLLASPIAWTGYTVLLIPCLWSYRIKRIGKFAILFFIIPFAYIVNYYDRTYLNFIIFGWWYGWGLLMLLFSILYEIYFAKS